MSKNVTQYDLLISCPGDVCDELEVIRESIERFNELYTDTLGIAIRPRYWKNSSYPKSGGHPQKLLNEEFIYDCDAAIAILWSRFGSPTDKYGSGTEEEIEIMLNSGKQVFMYFSDKPVPPSQLNSEQYSQVKAFKEKYSSRGLYFTYSSIDDFQKIVFAHLSQHFLSIQRVKELAVDQQPSLKLVGLASSGEICNKAYIESFCPAVQKNTSWYFNKIKECYQKISGIRTETRAVQSNNMTNLFAGISVGSKVEIPESDKKLILQVASQMEMSIDDDFFNLGNLTKSIAPVDLYGGHSLQGTDDEKRKYNTIKTLIETIENCLCWIPFEKAFQDYQCIKLAIVNEGKTFDEDVEITLSFPRKAVITIERMPAFDNETKGYLLNDCELSEIFGISRSPNYLQYDDSNVSLHAGNIRKSSFHMPGYTPDYEDDYNSELEDIFAYSVFQEDDRCILKLKVEYIKHNTAVAFPSVILVDNNLELIPYSITSKHFPEQVKGTIAVEEK